MNDDELERRLRGALSRPRPDDAVDTDDFLTQVHHGAKVRRVKRSVGIAAASVLAVTGGGLALNAGGLFNDTQTPVADGRTTPPTSVVTTGTTPGPGPGPLHTTTPSHPTRSVETVPPQTVSISPNGPIAADEVAPMSITATDDKHQWVFGRTPGRDCGRPQCASVFATDNHGTKTSWRDLGHLPAPPATSVDTPLPDSVSQLRFTKRSDTEYDGWAYGNALWSTHDSGGSWSNASSPPGQVTQLESWGEDVYAAVSNTGGGQTSATLYRSPSSHDDWQPVDVAGQALDGLTGVQALAAAKGVVGLIEVGNGSHPVVYVSHDGDAWQRESPCPPSAPDALALSTASNAKATVGSLWVTCQGVSTSVILHTETRDLGVWNRVSHDFPAAVIVAAQSDTTAFVAGGGLPGIERISDAVPPKPIQISGIGVPIYFGFTNGSYGYLLDSAGHIASTTNGGLDWSTYQVSSTSR